MGAPDEAVAIGEAAAGGVAGADAHRAGRAHRGDDRRVHPLVLRPGVAAAAGQLEALPADAERDRRLPWRGCATAARAAARARLAWARCRRWRTGNGRGGRWAWRAGRRRSRSSAAPRDRGTRPTRRTPRGCPSPPAGRRRPETRAAAIQRIAFRPSAGFAGGKERRKSTAECPVLLDSPGRPGMMARGFDARGETGAPAGMPTMSLLADYNMPFAAALVLMVLLALRATHRARALLRRSRRRRHRARRWAWGSGRRAAEPDRHRPGAVHDLAGELPVRVRRGGRGRAGAAPTACSARRSTAGWRRRSPRSPGCR